MTMDQMTLDELAIGRNYIGRKVWAKLSGHIAQFYQKGAYGVLQLHTRTLKVKSVFRMGTFDLVFQNMLG